MIYIRIPDIQKPSCKLTLNLFFYKHLCMIGISLNKSESKRQRKNCINYFTLQISMYCALVFIDGIEKFKNVPEQSSKWDFFSAVSTINVCTHYYAQKIQLQYKRITNALELFGFSSKIATACIIYVIFIPLNVHD